MSGARPERQRPDDAGRAVVLVTGLSGGGKVLGAATRWRISATRRSTIRRLGMLDDLVARERAQAGHRRRCPHPRLRRRRRAGHDGPAARPAGLRPELVYAWADETALLRRYTETRRRHPLAPQGRVADGIARRGAADRRAARGGRPGRRYLGPAAPRRCAG